MGGSLGVSEAHLYAEQAGARACASTGHSLRFMCRAAGSRAHARALPRGARTPLWLLETRVQPKHDLRDDVAEVDVLATRAAQVHRPLV